MEKIATDTFSFADIRQGGHVYVDKTAILKPLVDGSLGSQFFIARPRRFGKSLAISTFQCLFEGRRDLFKGLAIEPDWDWSKTYPVLKLNDTAASALAQIKAKGYHEKWLRRGKKVTLVGAAFDSDLRNLSDRQIEVAAK